jgi:UPF0755 protein
VKRLLAAIFLLAGAGVAVLAFQAFRTYRGYSGSVLVTIPPGSGAASAARILATRGVLRFRAPFVVLYGLGRLRHRTLKAGEYLFDHPLSPSQVYWKIVRGEIYYHLVVIPEGSDRFDIARILHDRLGLDPQDFLQTTAEATLVRDLDPAAPSLEGFLFPDTYRFAAGTTAAAVAAVMVARFRQVMVSRVQGALAAAPDQSLHQVLTLASLVEKESPNAAERAEIAGVFTRRLQRNMPLDCDPTVGYAARLTATSGALPAGSPPITAVQLNSDSPYNTYRHAGLPPGPICSPGAAAIDAALHPASGSALYFVTDLHGGYLFANTLAEHHRNVSRYRRAAASRGDEPQTKPEPGASPPHRIRRHRK